MLEPNLERGQIFPVSKLDKRYVNFIPLSDMNLMAVSDYATEAFIFGHFLYSIAGVNTQCASRCFEGDQCYKI